MKKIAALIPILLAAASCLSSGLAEKTAEATGPQPLTWFRYGNDPHGLQDALDCAIGRIRAATCLPLDVSYSAAHWVRFDDAANMPDKLGYTWGPTWSAVKTKVRAGMTSERTCNVLVHEISHVLRRSNGHVGAAVSSDPYPGDSVALIDAATLDAICEVQNCGCYQTEL